MTSQMKHFELFSSLISQLKFCELICPGDSSASSEASFRGNKATTVLSFLHYVSLYIAR